MSRPETIFDFDDTDRELVNRGGGGGGLLETSSTLTSYETEGGANSNKERKRRQLTAVYEGFQRLRPTPTLGKGTETTGTTSGGSLVPKEGLGWYKDSEGGDRYFLNGVKLDLKKGLPAWERYPQVDKETYLKKLLNRITTTTINLPPRIKLPEYHNNSLSSLTPHSLATLHHTGNLEKDITPYLYPTTDKFSGPDDPILPLKRHLTDFTSSRPTKRPTTNTTNATLPKPPLPSVTSSTTTTPFSTSTLTSYLTTLHTASPHLLQSTLTTRTQSFLDKTKVLPL